MGMFDAKSFYIKLADVNQVVSANHCKKRGTSKHVTLGIATAFFSPDGDFYDSV
jgi:hypothetical protein